MSFVYKNLTSVVPIGGIATLTGNTGGAISPTAGNINILGSGSISVAGSGSTLTISSSGGSGITTINGDSGSITGATVTLTGGTSGAVFSGSSATMTMSFNNVNLPTTTSSVGQVTIN